MNICIAGCGSLGSRIALELAHPDRSFLLIDDDRIEDVNIPVSAYFEHQIGAYKAVALAEMMWHKARCECTPATRTLDGKHWPAGMFQNDMIIDTFDNVEARSYTRFHSYSLHVALSAARTGAIEWDEWYTLPNVPYGREDNPVCTHMLGVPIIRFTAAVAANEVERWMRTGERRNYYLTQNLEIRR